METQPTFDANAFLKNIVENYFTIMEKHLELEILPFRRNDSKAVFAMNSKRHGIMLVAFEDLSVEIDFGQYIFPDNVDRSKIVYWQIENLIDSYGEAYAEWLIDQISDFEIDNRK